MLLSQRPSYYRCQGGKFRKRLSLISVSAQPPDNEVQTWHFLMDEVHCVYLLAWSKPHGHGLHVLKYYQSPHISLDKKAKTQHFLIDVVLNTVNRLAWSKPHWHRLIRINPDWRLLTGYSVETMVTCYKQ